MPVGARAYQDCLPVEEAPGSRVALGPVQGSRMRALPCRAVGVIRGKAERTGHWHWTWVPTPALNLIWP